MSQDGSRAYAAQGLCNYANRRRSNGVCRFRRSTQPAKSALKYRCWNAPMFGSKKAPDSKKPTNVAGAASKEQWHAVSVVAGSGPCTAVEKLSNKRFLSAQAPRLPLSECSCAWRCTCTYRHFQDRRTGARREVDRNGFARMRVGTERRKMRGRRAIDID